MATLAALKVALLLIDCMNTEYVTLNGLFEFEVGTAEIALVWSHIVQLVTLQMLSQVHCGELSTANIARLVGELLVHRVLVPFLGKRRAELFLAKNARQEISLLFN